MGIKQNSKKREKKKKRKILGLAIRTVLDTARASWNAVYEGESSPFRNEMVASKIMVPS